MKDIIKEIGLYRCPVRLKDPFIISLGKLEFADNVIITIRTSEGITGFGECSPFMTIHGENSDTAMAVGKMLATILLGRDSIDIGSCIDLMDTCIYANTSVKSAFDIALHDIAAQHASQPLYKFLGGSIDKTMYTDYTVSIGPVDKMVNDAVKIVENGFTVIKVKLGGKCEDDWMRLSAIRHAVGEKIPIRIDANQGWNTETAIELLHRFKSLNIEHCEEPVSRHNFLELPKIRAASQIPIMCDESCFDERDAQRLVKLHACDLFNVKLGKSSGIYKANKIIRIAEESGIDLQAGGFLESRLGFTAMAHVSLSSERFKFFDFDTPLMFTEDPVTGGITYSENGRITMPEGNGLAASIDAKILNGLQKIIVN